MAQQAGLLAARFVRCLAISDGDPEAAIAMARGAGWTQVAEALRASGLGRELNEGLALAQQLKAASAPMAMADAAAATAAVALDFSEAVRARSILGKLPRLRSAPLNVRMIAAGRLGRARVVSEGGPAPVVAASFESQTLLPARIAAVAVQSMELVRDSSPASEQIVATDLIASAAEEVDTIFCSTTDDGSDGPQGIFSNVAEVLYSGSWDSAFEAAMGLFADAKLNPSTAAWILPLRLLAHLQLLRSGGGALLYPSLSNGANPTLLNIPVATSAVEPVGSPGELVLGLVAQNEILVGDAGSELSVSRNAAVEMNDAPSGGPQPLLSLWQSNAVGIMSTTWINWRRRRPEAAIAIRGFGL